MSDSQREEFGYKSKKKIENNYSWKFIGDKYKKLWDYHLKGLLKEYFRGMEDAENLIAKLKSAYDGAGQQAAALAKSK